MGRLNYRYIKRLLRRVSKKQTDQLGLANRVFKVPEPVYPGMIRSAGQLKEHPEYVREQMLH